MKKLFVIMILSTMVSCANSKEELKMLMWSDTIPVEVYKAFEEETGIRIVEDAISSNEEIYSKIKASGGGYDIIVPSLDYAHIMINEELIQELDISKMPNLTNSDPNILSYVLEIDPNQQYIMPFLFGVTTINYNSTKVEEDVVGFDIFTNSAYKNKMILLNDMREVLGSALIYLGYDIGETNEVALKEVEKLLRIWKDNVLRFDADSYQIAYANGEADIVHGYPDTVSQVLTEEQKEVTKYIVPDKGAIMWIDSFLVLKDSKNVENAQKFINFIHRPEIYAQVMDYLGALSLNILARDLMETEPLISYEGLTNVTMLRDIGNDSLQIQSRTWENVQAQ